MESKHTTTTQHITIQGAIVYDVELREHRFIDYLIPQDFKNGAYRTEYSNLVLICEHQIDIEAPVVDLVKPQLDALDAKEADLTAKYQAAKTEIERQRQNLLALEFEGAEAC